MNKKSTAQQKMGKIVLEIDQDVQHVFDNEAQALQRLLDKKVRGAIISQGGTGGGKKDAVSLIVATSALIATATPLIKAILSAYLARRGCTVEDQGDAKGKYKLRISPAKASPSAKPRSRKATPKPKARL